MSINKNNESLNEILSMINNLPSADGLSGGTVYTNIVYNDDNTVTLTDKDGVDHTMICEYTDGVLSGLTYDGKSVELTYEEDALVNIGATEVDMANVPIESGGGTEEIENLIDESGVLDTTDGTATEKVEQLIDKAEDLKALNEVTSKRKIFRSDYENVSDSFVVPYTDFSNAESIYYFCYNSGVTDIPFYINSTNCTSLYSAFSKTPNFKHMVGIDVSKVTQAYNCFYQSGIEEIDEPFDFSSVTNTNNSPNFNQCNNLKKIRFKANTLKYSMTFTSPVLSDESIESIIDGLATVETAQTLRLHTDVKAKLTEEQLATITSKNWNLA